MTVAPAVPRPAPAGPVPPEGPAGGAGAGGGYVSQVAFHLRGWGQGPAFLRMAAALVGLFGRSPGAVRLHLSAFPRRRQFVSHSVWRDPAAMQAYFRSEEHREAVRRSFQDTMDEYYSFSTGGVLHYCQRCPACAAWARGEAPRDVCPRCGAALRRYLDPVPREPVALPGPEYGAVTPEVTPEGNGLRVLTGVFGPIPPAAAETAFRVLNLTPLLWWAAMILAPRAAPTRALAGSPLPYAGLGVFYLVALLKAFADRGAPDYGSLRDGPQRLFGSDAGLLAGWAHYLAFDLFAGLWVYRTGLAEGRTTRVPLLLTFLAGPAGLLWFLVQRGIRRPV